jgi:hypothetical protein
LSEHLGLTNARKCHHVTFMCLVCQLNRDYDLHSESRHQTKSEIAKGAHS